MTSDDDLPPADPAATLRLIQQQQAEAARRLSVHTLSYFWPWGLAWLIGFGLFFLRFGPDGRVFVRLPEWLPLTVLFVLLAVAGAISGLAGARAYGQVAGESSQRAAWWGMAWFAGYASLGITLSRVTDHLPEELAGLLWAGGAVGLTGALQLAGSAIWLDRDLFVVGAWVTAINIAGLLAGPGWHALVLSVAGGGGMLVGGTAIWLRRRARAVAAP